MGRKVEDRNYERRNKGKIRERARELGMEVVLSNFQSAVASMLRCFAQVQ